LEQIVGREELGLKARNLIAWAAILTMNFF